MLYVEPYHRYRQDQHVRVLPSNHQLLRCNNDYPEPCPSPGNEVTFDSNQTLFLLTQMPPSDLKTVDGTEEQRKQSSNKGRRSPKKDVSPSESTQLNGLALKPEREKHAFPSISESVKSPRSPRTTIEDTIHRTTSSHPTASQSIDALKLPLRKTENTSRPSTSMDLTRLSSNKDQEEAPLIPHRSSQSPMSGFRHIVNLGHWQRNEAGEHGEFFTQGKDTISDVDFFAEIDQYKAPFPEEYEEAISFQGQLVANNCGNEWTFREFYREVKTNLDPDTNSKAVFEKCIKLARIQAQTIKWEQRRRQNLIVYNRLLKNPSPDTPPNGHSPSKILHDRDINELRRELRCTECKRLACLGNCAPGQDYHQYKRIISLTSLCTNRDPLRSKLSARTARSSIQIRPRSQLQMSHVTKYKIVSNNVNPLVAVPAVDTGGDSSSKQLSKK